MIERLIPKYPTFLVLGFIVVASGLFILTAGRDAVIVVWANKFFDGKTDDGLFEASQIADQVLGHTLSVWPFLVSASSCLVSGSPSPPSLGT